MSEAKEYMLMFSETGYGFLVKAPEDLDRAIKVLEEAEAWGPSVDAAAEQAPGWADPDFRYVKIEEPLFSCGALCELDDRTIEKAGMDLNTRWYKVHALDSDSAMMLLDAAGAKLKKGRNSPFTESIHIGAGGSCELELMHKKSTAYVPLENMVAALKEIQADRENAGPRP